MEKAHDELVGKSAENGTLMRCLPVVLAYSDSQKIDETSALQSKITHYDDLASEAGYSNQTVRRMDMSFTKWNGYSTGCCLRIHLKKSSLVPLIWEMTVTPQLQRIKR